MSNSAPQMHVSCSQLSFISGAFVSLSCIILILLLLLLLVCSLSNVLIFGSMEVPDLPQSMSNADAEQQPQQRSRRNVSSFISARLLHESRRSSSSTTAFATGSLFSPNFRSAAANAGWDADSLLASIEEQSSSPLLLGRVVDLNDIVIEDSPDRQLQQQTRKRQDRTPTLAATPGSLAGRNRRSRTQDLDLENLPRVCSLRLDDEVLILGAEIARDSILQFRASTSSTNESNAKENKTIPKVDCPKSKKEDCKPVTYKDSETQMTPVKADKSNSVKGSADKKKEEINQPQIQEKLKEELSCAICLEISFEPSTTSCGHSFCRTCLKGALEKCGPRCPKCRQALKRDFNSCQINTVLWNTIQMLFPTEVAEKIKAREAEKEKKKSKEKQENSEGAAGGRNRVSEPRPFLTGSTISRANRTSLGRNVERDQRMNRQRRELPSRFRNPTTSSRIREADLQGHQTIETDDVRTTIDDLTRMQTMSRQRQEQIDAQIAARLQEREFRDRPRGGFAQPRTVSSAAANLRAMASRAIQRVRN